MNQNTAWDILRYYSLFIWNSNLTRRPVFYLGPKIAPCLDSLIRMVRQCHVLEIFALWHILNSLGQHMAKHGKETSLHFSDFPYISQGITVLERKLSCLPWEGREESRLTDMSHPYSPAERFPPWELCPSAWIHSTHFTAPSVCQLLQIKTPHHFASEELRLGLPKIT